LGKKKKKKGRKGGGGIEGGKKEENSSQVQRALNDRKQMKYPVTLRQKETYSRLRCIPEPDFQWSSPAPYSISPPTSSPAWAFSFPHTRACPGCLFPPGRHRS
jgi:hypothetical protein